MTKHYILVGLIVAALVAVVLSMSGIVDASELTQAQATEKPTRDRTQNPRRTKTPTAAAEVTETPQPGATVDAEEIAAGQLSSQLVLINPERSAAKVSINVYDDAGTVAFSDNFRIKENGARMVTLPKSVGSNFMGSAQVVADRRIQALVLDASGDASASDAYEVQRGGSTILTLPSLRHLAIAGQDSLIAIQNTSGGTANATLKAYNTAGVEVLSEPLSIPARASVYLKTDDLFGATPFDGSAVITGDQSLAAAELTTYQQDTASLRAYMATDAASRLVVSGMTQKKNKQGTVTAWQEIFVRNQSNAATDITLQFYNQKGDLVGSVGRSGVPAGGLAILDTRNPEFSFLGKKFSGWANIESTNQAPLLAHALASIGQGKQRVGYGGIARAAVTGRSVCGDIRTTNGQTSALTLMNPRNKGSAAVRLRLYARADGGLVKDFFVTVSGNGQTRVTTANGLPKNFEGLAIVSPEGKDSKSILAMVTTQTKKGKTKSTSGYVCR